MNIRIGALIVSVNFIFLIFAGAFFIAVSLKEIYPEFIKEKSHAVTALLMASCAGFFGGWLYGLIGMMHETKLTGLPPSIISLYFGSFGGYWGVLCGISIYSLFKKIPPLLLADTLIPGILIGGSIARIGDYFTDSSRGILLNLYWAQWFQPFKHWFLYDIAALVFIQFLIMRMSAKTGQKTLLFLLGYGSIRFALEFVRDTVPFYEWVTYGQLMAFMQVGFGMILFFRIYPSIVDLTCPYIFSGNHKKELLKNFSSNRINTDLS